MNIKEKAKNDKTIEKQNQTFYPDIKQSWGIFGLIILMMILFSPVFILLKNVTGDEIALLVYYLLSMGTPLWIAHSRRKKRTGIAGYKLGAASLKTMALVSVGILAIQIGIVSPLVELIPMNEMIKQIFIDFASRNSVFSFITLVIAAPIFEETIFRGIILDGLLRKYSPIKSIFISSLLFGVVHLNPWQFVAALLIGFFAGWIYYKTRKLSLAILIHFINNLVSYLNISLEDPEVLINQTWAESYGGITNAILFTVAAIILSVACIILLNKEFKNTESDFI